MKNDLIIPAHRQKESISRSVEIHNALQDFDLPFLSIDKLESEKNQFFKILRDCVIDVNALQQIANSKVLIAEIPSEFRSLYAQGKIKLDESAKVLGNHTPNLRDGDGNLIGQLTIKEGFNPTALTNAMANMALYNAVREISEQVEQLNHTVTKIHQGQKDDRYAKITSAYETYELLLKEEQKQGYAPTAIGNIKEGLHQIHLGLKRQIDDFKEEAPRNKWEFRWKSLKNIRGYYTDRLKHDLDDMNQELFLYQGFILLSDILMNDMGQEPQNIIANHSDFNNLCKRTMDDKTLMKKLSFVKESDYAEIMLLNSVENNYVNLLKQNIDTIQLELSQTDIKLLNQYNYE